MSRNQHLQFCCLTAMLQRDATASPQPYMACEAQRGAIKSDNNNNKTCICRGKGVVSLLLLIKLSFGTRATLPSDECMTDKREREISHSRSLSEAACLPPLCPMCFASVALLSLYGQIAWVWNALCSTALLCYTTRNQANIYRWWYFKSRSRTFFVLRLYLENEKKKAITDPTKTSGLYCTWYTDTPHEYFFSFYFEQTLQNDYMCSRSLVGSHPVRRTWKADAAEDMIKMIKDQAREDLCVEVETNKTPMSAAPLQDVSFPRM